MIHPRARCIRSAAFRTGRDGDDNVLALFAVDAIHVHEDLALVDAELRSLADGKSYRMFCVFWTKVKYHAVGFENVLQAVRLLRSGLRDVAGNGIHLKKFSGLVRL